MASFYSLAFAVTAVQWTGRNWPQITSWGDESIRLNHDFTIALRTEGATYLINQGDWIIKKDDNYYPCRDVTFKTFFGEYLGTVS